MHVSCCAERKCGFSKEEYSAFVNTCEGGLLLHCDMSFALGFPCKPLMMVPGCTFFFGKSLNFLVQSVL